MNSAIWNSTRISLSSFPLPACSTCTLSILEMPRPWWKSISTRHASAVSPPCALFMDAGLAYSAKWCERFSPRPLLSPRLKTLRSKPAAGAQPWSRSSQRSRPDSHLCGVPSASEQDALVRARPPGRALALSLSHRGRRRRWCGRRPHGLSNAKEPFGLWAAQHQEREDSEGCAVRNCQAGKAGDNLAEHTVLVT